MRTTVLLAACLVASFAYAAQVRERDVAWIAPPEAASKQNPLAGQADVVAGGRKLFHQRCVSCHNKDARGTSKGPDLTDEAVQEQTDGALFWKVTSGNSHAGMPAFSFLPEPQRWQVVLAIRDLAHSVGR
jgi:mono/diheme cytochrome c family protein